MRDVTLHAAVPHPPVHHHDVERPPRETDRWPSRSAPNERPTRTFVPGNDSHPGSGNPSLPSRRSFSPRIYFVGPRVHASVSSLLPYGNHFHFESCSTLVTCRHRFGQEERGATGSPLRTLPTRGCRWSPGSRSRHRSSTAVPGRARCHPKRVSLIPTLKMFHVPQRVVLPRVTKPRSEYIIANLSYSFFSEPVVNLFWSSSNFNSLQSAM